MVIRRNGHRRRKDAMDHILHECYGNYDFFVAMQVALRLEYSLSEIGSEYFVARVEEAKR